MRKSLTTFGLAVTVALLASSMPAASAATHWPMPQNDGPASVEIQPGNAGISMSPGGELTIAGTKDCVGLNPDSRYVFGNPNNPTGEPGFVIEVQASPDEMVNVSFDSERCHAGSVRFVFYDAAGRVVGRIDAESDSTGLPVNSARARFYTVMIIETGDRAAGQRLQGSIRVSA